MLEILFIFFWYTLCFAVDVNECGLFPRPCDENAECYNTRGSYQCRCFPGFSGDGHTCTSMCNLDVYGVNLHSACSINVHLIFHANNTAHIFCIKLPTNCVI